MHTSWPVFQIAAVTFTSVLALGLAGLAIFEHRKKISTALNVGQRLLDAIENQGTRLKEHKDVWLAQWIDFVPLSADTLSWLRLLIIVTVWTPLYHEHRYSQSALAFAAAWLTDLLDGAKARAEQRRTKRPSHHGKALDVSIDIVCFVWLSGWMHQRLPTAFLWGFGCTLLIRSIYGGYLAIRQRWWPKARLRFLPDSNAGKYKTVVIVTAYGMVALWPTAQTIGAWARNMLFVGLGLEFVSLIQQGFRALRQLHSPFVPSLVEKSPPIITRTGTD